VTQVFEKERALQREVEEKIAAGAPDVEVLALELQGPERFCVYIDHPRGVDHALCERVTDLLRGYLDRYTVDVSSPGLTRPLRRREHFARASGRRVTVRTEREIGGRTRFKGEVAEAGEHALALRLADGSVEIPYAEIVRSNLIDEDGAP
jgi:ribosome maturation factor RimP